jgi:hypothetical protein
VNRENGRKRTLSRLALAETRCGSGCIRLQYTSAKCQADRLPDVRVGSLSAFFSGPALSSGPKLDRSYPQGTVLSVVSISPKSRQTA